VSDLTDFGRPLLVNRSGRDTNGLGRRRSGPDEQRRYRAPVEQRLAERRRQRPVDDEDEDETEANELERTGDYELDEYLRRHRREFGG
jgi:hypothetical protein